MSANGRIVGDAAEALGRLREPRARDILERCKESDVDWIRNKATWALRQLDENARM